MSKRIWQHPDVPEGETTVAWKSVGQIEDTPSFREWLEREFPRGAAEMNDEEEQAMEQWLRRVPDDPAGLLREKFRYESRQRQQLNRKPDNEIYW